MMSDPSALYAIGSGVAGALAGYMGGKGARTAQADTITALSARVDDQQKTIETIPALQEEVRVLTGLVTQRAPVEQVIEIVTRIEEKLNEAPRQP